MLTLKKLLYELVEKVYQAFIELGKSDKKDRAVFMIKKYVSDNINKRIGLDQLAELTGLTPNHLCGRFKRKTGQTMIEYINKCKLERARMLLLTTGKTVKEISDGLGFENYTYFFRLFRRYEKMTPLQYRSRHLINYYQSR